MLKYTKIGPHPKLSKKTRRLCNGNDHLSIVFPNLRAEQVQWPNTWTILRPSMSTHSKKLWTTWEREPPALFKRSKRSQAITNQTPRCLIGLLLQTERFLCPCATTKGKKCAAQPTCAILPNKVLRSWHRPKFLAQTKCSTVRTCACSRRLVCRAKCPRLHTVSRTFCWTKDSSTRQWSTSMRTDPRST